MNWSKHDYKAPFTGCWMAVVSCLYFLGRQWFWRLEEHKTLPKAGVAIIIISPHHACKILNNIWIEDLVHYGNIRCYSRLHCKLKDENSKESFRVQITLNVAFLVYWKRLPSLERTPIHFHDKIIIKLFAEMHRILTYLMSLLRFWQKAQPYATIWAAVISMHIYFEAEYFRGVLVGSIRERRTPERSFKSTPLVVFWSS